ncbi:hypothetical protein E4N62_31285 [Streptomyces sp. MNU76]|uniref:hypothetical protein n=1 Tax=Streptomyces sp. MNU76 TaxID=2560026 RepID=UPI001E4886CE|nr:hypothetical protein [Streptomyces sp. MNU76]MCC9709340.1 hypothetical protein [Streptomyces sp. MNU76]
MVLAELSAHARLSWDFSWPEPAAVRLAPAPDGTQTDLGAAIEAAVANHPGTRPLRTLLPPGPRHPRNGRTAMTVLLWILAVLAVPTLLFGLWIAGVFLKEFFRPNGDVDPDVAEKMGLLPAERQNTEFAGPLPVGVDSALAAVRGGDRRSRPGCQAGPRTCQARP